MAGYKTISLFSGALGLDLGIEEAGFDIRVCVDYDKHACETARINRDMPVIEADINDVPTNELLKTAGLKKGSVDLLVGGPPCQAFSTAGARRAMDDFRGNVIINFLRLVEDIMPKVFLLENVRGLLTSKLTFVPKGLEKEYSHIVGEKGSVLYFLIKEFEKLGYAIDFELFDSANFGVPQIRDRILIFGSLGKKSIKLPTPTHNNKANNGLKSWVTISEAFEGLDEDSLNYVNLSEKQKRFVKHLKPGQYWRHLPVDMQKEAMGGSYELSGGRTGFYRRLSWDRPSPTLVTSPVMNATLLCHPEKLRPLSIEEYLRIQQFPDDWKMAGSLREQYKQIGNAVPVGLGLAAGRAIADYFKGKNQKRDNGNIRYSRYRNTGYAPFISKFDNAQQALI